MTLKWYLPSLSYLTNWDITAPIQTLTDAQIQAIPSGTGSIDPLVKGSGPAVYYVLNGMLHHIADQRQFAVYGLDWTMFSQVDDSLLAQVPLGAPIGILAKSATEPQVYLLTLNTKYYIPDVATLQNWGFSLSSIDTIPQSVIDSIPTSETLTSLVQFPGSSNIYVVSNSQLLYVGSQNLLNQWGLTFGMVSLVGPEERAVMSIGPNFSQVAKGSGPNVYYIQGDTKRYVSSWSRLSAVGASQSSLVTVPDSLLGQLSTGPNL